MNKSQVENLIDQEITNNGNGDITGDVLNNVLKQILNVEDGEGEIIITSTRPMNYTSPFVGSVYVYTGANTTWTDAGGIVYNVDKYSAWKYTGSTWAEAKTYEFIGGHIDFINGDTFGNSILNTAMSRFDFRNAEFVKGNSPQMAICGFHASGNAQYKYPAGSIVMWSGAPYLCKQLTDGTSTTNDPTNTTYWHSL